MKFSLYLAAMLMVCGTVRSQVSDKYTELGYFAITKQVAILPVQLVNFEVAKKDKSVWLGWETLTEINSGHFTIERSANGTEFKPLTTVQAAGNSNARKAYQAWDNQPLPGRNYYRLTQYDKDGKAALFPVKMIEMPLAKKSLKVYPNPLSGKVFYVAVPDGNFTGQITITGAQGQKLYSASLMYGQCEQAIQLDKPLPAGLYFVTLTLNNASQTVKLMVK